MRIASARLLRLGGRLPLAISNSGASWTTRHGLLLQLFCEEGLFGQGEASPLPGYSRDTIEECEAALTALGPEDFGELDLILPAADAGAPLARRAPTARRRRASPSRRPFSISSRCAPGDPLPNCLAPRPLCIR